MYQPDRCSQHYDVLRMPNCATCKRKRVERLIVTKAVDACLSAGYALHIDGRGDDDRPETPTQDRATILHELMETDDDFMVVSRHLSKLDPTDINYRAIGWVRFVYGNDGYDVISDYTTNLESVLAPVNTYADRFEPV